MESAKKVAIVTGSATGIGAAVALRLAGKGVNVVINYSRSVGEAEATAEACRALGVEALLCRADVAADADCRAMAEAAIGRWGRIDYLVNNAGTTVFADHADLDAVQAEDFRRIYDVNVIGAYQMVRAVAAQMKRQGQGSVVNISSIAGLAGIGSSIAYAASKGALNTLTLSLARALAPEIRVNAVCPGLVKTRWLKQGLGDEKYERSVAANDSRTPLKSSSGPEEIAEPVVWLLEGAAHVTGELISVDAGMHLGFG
ncbi:MAG TPA: SDR family oxidoreductase [Aliidongia sp.]|nr:SDR family oxidoreductase [Aliidongia sp.]